MMSLRGKSTMRALFALLKTFCVLFVLVGAGVIARPVAANEGKAQPAPPRSLH